MAVILIMLQEYIVVTVYASSTQEGVEDRSGEEWEDKRSKRRSGEV